MKQGGTPVYVVRPLGPNMWVIEGLEGQVRVDV